MGFLQKVINPFNTIFLYKDKEYARKRFTNTFGYELNLSNPKTFNEKIQWIKLYWRPSYISELADKILVREFIEDKIGSEYLNPLIGTFSSYNSFFKKIETFPKEYVIKVNHGSGWNIFINNTKIFNNSKDRDIIKGWLKLNYYYRGREWCYKNIKPRIMVEKYIKPSFMEEYGLLDFKIFCFSGNPLYVQVDFNRDKYHARNIYDVEWNLLPLKIQFDNLSITMSKPHFLDDMIQLCRIISKNIPFCRIDFYYTEKIIFGEITFYPGNGFEKFSPQEFDKIFGKDLILPISI